ncbi:MAG: hypothetical protein R3C42_05615 [Parvularculaceae bacterium]|nr:hypothetical protein [Parvularculaceae bacterium]
MIGILTVPDVVGLIGVALVVVTYFLSQIGKMNTTRALYPGLNAIGAAMILVSLYFRPNPPSVVIELFWLAISIVGLARALYNKIGVKPRARP